MCRRQLVARRLDELEVNVLLRELLRTRARLNELYVTHTERPLAEIEKVMDRDTFMDVHQALEFGIIDHTLTKRSAPPSS